MAATAPQHVIDRSAIPEWPRKWQWGWSWVAAVPVAVAFHLGLLWIIHAGQPLRIPVAPELAVVLAPVSESASIETAQNQAVAVDTAAPDASVVEPAATDRANDAEPTLATSDFAVTQARVESDKTVRPDALESALATPAEPVRPSIANVAATAEAQPKPATPSASVVKQETPDPVTELAPVADVMPVLAESAAEPALLPSPENLVDASAEAVDELDDADELDNPEAIAEADIEQSETFMLPATDDVETTIQKPLTQKADETTLATSVLKHGLTTQATASVLTATMQPDSANPELDASFLAKIQNADLPTPVDAISMHASMPVKSSADEPLRVASTAARIDVGRIRASHEAQILELINKNKRYPIRARQRGDEGVAKVAFTIVRTGEVVDSTLVTSSGHRTLDRESLALINRVPIFPAIPDELSLDQLTVTVPVRFSL